MNDFEMVARRLCKRDVVVRFQRPPFSFASGCAHKTRTGNAVIDIDPLPADSFQVFLHECAHIRQDWQDMVPGDYWKAAPASINYPAKTQAYLSSLPRETKAKELAEQWLSYGLRYAHRYEGAHLPILEALKKWPFDEILDRAAVIGQQTALKYIQSLRRK